MGRNQGSNQHKKIQSKFDNLKSGGSVIAILLNHYINHFKREECLLKYIYFANNFLSEKI